MAFHESRVVLIETGRRVVRAGLGLGELLHVPSLVCRPERRLIDLERHSAPLTRHK